MAAPDPTFTEIVVPGAKAALEYARAASPLQACQKVRPPYLNDLKVSRTAFRDGGSHIYIGMH